MAKGQIRTNKEKKKPKSEGKKQDLPKYMRSGAGVTSTGAQGSGNQKK
jgi:hypothetical protein